MKGKEMKAQIYRCKCGKAKFFIIPELLKGKLEDILVCRRCSNENEDK